MSPSLIFYGQYLKFLPRKCMQYARGADCLEGEMYLLSASIDQILQNSESASLALRKLYETFKAHDKKYSIQYFCRKTGMASKGNFSHMLTGKRPVAKHHWKKLCEAFKLTHIQTDKFLEILSESQPTCDTRCSKTVKLSDD